MTDAERQKKRRWLAVQLNRLDALDAGLRDRDYASVEATRGLLRKAVANAGPEDLRVLLLSLRAQAQSELKSVTGID